ncbi:MAG TPA: HNH endonuclease [Candidatus Acidoferrales bacterium]|nr:HNH endonuclease [Candidatus Acidoferrales bacterium]
MPGLKVFPDKICKTCGAAFNRRMMPNGRLQDVKLFLAQEHCSRTCGNSRKELKPKSYLWRARKHRKDACEACGYTKRLTVHHCDQDQTNNDPANLQTLCSHCHDFWHATAKRLGKTVAGRMVCLV